MDDRTKNGAAGLWRDIDAHYIPENQSGGYAAELQRLEPCERIVTIQRIPIGASVGG